MRRREAKVFVLDPQLTSALHVYFKVRIAQLCLYTIKIGQMGFQSAETVRLLEVVSKYWMTAT